MVVEYLQAVSTHSPTRHENQAVCPNESYLDIYTANRSKRRTTHVNMLS